MPLSNPFRRQTERPTLRERAADLKAGLSRVIRHRDPEPAAAPEAVPADSLEEFAEIEFGAYALDEPLKTPTAWATRFSDHAVAMHVADRTVRMTKPELIAFIREAGEKDPEMPAAMFHALDSGQKSLEGWGNLLGLARARYIVAATAACGELGASNKAAPEAKPTADIPDPKFTADFCPSEPAPSDLDALALVSVIEAEWSAMARSGVLEGSRPENDEALDVACNRRGALLDAADALPADTREARHAKALALAWIEWVELWRPGRLPRETTEERLTFDIHAGMREIPNDVQPTSAPTRITGLIDLIDFASVSMSDLRSLYDLAEEVGNIAYAFASSGRGEGRSAGPILGCHFNAAGELMQWLGDALTDVESTVIAEARRRAPATKHDQEIRLEILALPIIQNDDPGEIEAFAFELLAHAAAERAKG